MTNTAIATLEASIPNLNGRSQEFARSLIDQFNKKGFLSSKQWPYVTQLSERANQPRPQVQSDDMCNLGDFGGVFELIQTAAANLKHPKVRLQTEDCHPVVLSIAGPRSRYPGQINVTDGGPYGANRWYGRIDGEGRWGRPRNSDGLDQVEAVLRRLGDAPAETAAEHGKLTGRCCFCNRGLEDDRSTEQGYGPVCAKNYGLPWGSK